MAVLTAVLRPTRWREAHVRPKARALAAAPEEKLEAIGGKTPSSPWSDFSRTRGWGVTQADVLDWFEREAKPEAADDAEEFDEAEPKLGGA